MSLMPCNWTFSTFCTLPICGLIDGHDCADRPEDPAGSSSSYLLHFHWYDEDRHRLSYTASVATSDSEEFIIRHQPPYFCLVTIASPAWSPSFRTSHQHCFAYVPEDLLPEPSSSLPLACSWVFVWCLPSVSRLWTVLEVSFRLSVISICKEEHVIHQHPHLNMGEKVTLTMSSTRRSMSYGNASAIRYRTWRVTIK